MAATPNHKKAVGQKYSNEAGINSIPKPKVLSVLLLILFALLIYLQAILWVGEGSIAEVWRLKKSIAIKEKENQALKERNQKLIEEVEALRNGLELIEHKAREDLGLVKENEVFYHVIDERTPEKE